MPLLIDNLQSYYRLDEFSGSRLDSQSLADLVAHNGPGHVAGILGEASSFVAASNQYLESLATFTTVTGPYTLACWVKLNTLTLDSIFFLVSDIHIQYQHTLNRFRGGLFSGPGLATHVANTFGAPSAGIYYHVVVWIDPVNGQRGISVNGIDDISSYTAGLLGSVGPTTIGAAIAGGGSVLDGAVDEAGWWNRVLSRDERLALYNSGVGYDYSNFGSPLPGAIDVNLTLQESEELESAGAFYGQVENLDLTLQDIEPIESLLYFIGVDSYLDLTLQEIDEPEELATSITFSLDLTLQEIDEPSILEMSAGINVVPVNLDLTLQDAWSDREALIFPLETRWSNVVTLTVQDAFLEPELYLAFTTIFQPHVPGDARSHFAEVSRSATNHILFGTEPGPFKLNVSAASQRRDGRNHVLQLGPARPPFREIHGLFTAATPLPELAIREFDYLAPGGYLEIWNDTILSSALVPDGAGGSANWATAASGISLVNPNLLATFPAVAATTFHASRVYMP